MYSLSSQSAGCTENRFVLVQQLRDRGSNLQPQKKEGISIIVELCSLWNGNRILETVVCIFIKKPFSISLILNYESLTPTVRRQKHAASIF